MELCLKSVEAAIADLEAEIIVVDNYSSDDSCAMVKSGFPNVRLIENEVNYGFSKGNNQGVAIANGEFICILNPDTVIPENTFDQLLSFAEQHDDLGILGCRLIDGSGTFLPESKRNVPMPWVASKKLLGLSDAYYANQIGELEIGQVPILVGAFMLMKKSIFNRVGGFDEDYFMYGEDIDLSYRILKLGFQNFYKGTVSVVHFKGESTIKDKTYVKRFYGAMQIFYKKHFRSNWLFDFMVWIGLRFTFLFRKRPKEIKLKVEHYVLVSKQIPEKLQSGLKKPIVLFQKINTIKENSEIILDANVLNYKEIIEYISDTKINTKAKFKILPKNSNFIIGSNSSKIRGEVINFSDK